MDAGDDASSYDPVRCSDDECREFIQSLFPQGMGGDDVMGELAPAGWDESPLAAVFHPSPEQQFEETKQMHENLQSLARKKDDQRPETPPTPPPTLEEFQAEFEPQPYEPQKELRELMARCLWDVFSDNHEVFAPDGRQIDLGSFRASGGFIADLLNEEIGAPQFDEEAYFKEMLASPLMTNPNPSVEDIMQHAMAEAEKPKTNYNYLDVYMGTSGVSGRADLTPVYELIFRRLKQRGADWTYHFPRLHLVDFRPLKEALDANDPDKAPEWESYDPAESFAEEQEQAEKDAEIAETREKLDEAYRESVEEAQHGPPPKTVEAYRAVYGEFPEGWPPKVES